MASSVNLTIDDVPVSVPPGTTLIEAAKQAGVLVPHYCYHPSLPSPALCRMCLVEVEGAPKLLPACVSVVAEGQVVRTQSQPARKAREAVLEFLLINHPLDCPICDQAGECELQDYVFQEGRAGTRYGEYPKRFNPVEDFGPDILYALNEGHPKIVDALRNAAAGVQNFVANVSVPPQIPTFAFAEGGLVTGGASNTINNSPTVNFVVQTQDIGGVQRNRTQLMQDLTRAVAAANNRR